MKQWISNNPFNLWSKAKWELSLDMLTQRSWDLWISNFEADKERWRMVLREGKSVGLHPWRLKALPSLHHHRDRHGGVSLPFSSPWTPCSGWSLPLWKFSPATLILPSIFPFEGENVWRMGYGEVKRETLMWWCRENTVLFLATIHLESSGHPHLYFIHSLWNFSFGSLCFTS